MDLLDCISYLSLAFAVAYALAIAGRNKTSHKRFPPGPSPWPIVGNLFSMGSKPHKSLYELAKTHGAIMKLKLGTVTTVVISSSTMAKEVLQKHDLAFSSRTIPDAVRAHDHHIFSVGWLPVSTTWRTLRKIMNSNIFTTQKLDSSLPLRYQKIQELVSDLQKACSRGNSVDIGEAAFRTTLNLLSNTIFSLDLAYSNSNSTREFRELMWNVSLEAGKPNLVDCFPMLRVLDLQGIRRRLAVQFGKIMAIFGQIINRRLESRELQGFETENDMLDILLNIIKDNSNEIGKNHIDHLLLDLFTAGVDTTANTIEWAMAGLLRNPETLSKAQTEMKKTVGRGKPIEESDIAKLPYLQAIVKETFRLHPTVPLLIPHKVDADVEVCGFIVPKNAKVLVNVWAIGRDPNTWETPDLFLPERFLGSKLDIKGKDFELIPFGAGRRICPGMSLGVRMVYLMLGSLINSFDWQLEHGVAPDDISMEEKFGITLKKAKPLCAIPINV